jgi:hypothetical protein
MLYRGLMTDADEHHVRQRGLADLQRDFPRYRIWQEPMGSQIRLVAVCRDSEISPHTLVTAGLAELRAALAISTTTSGTP